MEKPYNKEMEINNNLKQARALMIYPDVTGLGGKYSHAVGLLSSIIQNAGHEFKLLHLTDKNISCDYLKEVEIFNPDIILFSVTTNQYKLFQEINSKIKNNLSTPTCIGGVHATLTYKQVLLENDIDIVNVGDGETSIIKIINNYNSIENLIGEPNICIKINNRIFECDRIESTEDLDQLPFEDMSVFNPSLLDINPKRQLDVLTSRGCIYGCTYCCNKILLKTNNKKIRSRSPQNVINELKQLNAFYKPYEVKFDDDIFTYNKEWLEEFCKLYKDEINIPFQINTRIEYVDEHRIKILKDANCRLIRMGIESGNEWLRKHVLNRHHTNTDIINAFSLIKKHGIKTVSYNMIGLPLETKNMAMETYYLNKIVDPYLVLCSIFYPYPNTGIYELCLKYNLIADKYGKANWYEMNTICKMPHFSKEEIKKVYDKMDEFHVKHQIYEHYKYLKHFHQFLSFFIGYSLSYKFWRSLLRLNVEKKMK